MRRFAAVLIVILSLMSFFVTSTFAQGVKKPAKKEHVVKKKAHKTVKGEKKHVKKKHSTVKRGRAKAHKSHVMKKKVKEEKEDSRIKVN